MKPLFPTSTTKEENISNEFMAN